MYSRITVYVLLVVCACLLLTLPSCRKDDPPKQPRVFNPEVDGVAVRPSQQIDLELANRILRGEMEPPAMDEGSVPAAVVPTAPGAPGGGLVSPVLPGAPPPAPESAGSYDYDSLDDPNLDF